MDTNTQRHAHTKINLTQKNQILLPALILGFPCSVWLGPCRSLEVCLLLC